MRTYLSTIDRKVLNSIQDSLPLDPQPFKILSKKLGMKEKELIQRIKKLKDKGVIRNFAASLNHTKLGFKSTLIGLNVPAEKIASIARDVSNYPEVTHCFLRDGSYNIWVVFIYSKEARLRGFLMRLVKRLGVENILNLPTKRKFKLKTRLEI